MVFIGFVFSYWQMGKWLIGKLVDWGSGKWLFSTIFNHLP
jgi:hypothetical protein